jgi:hypothetical protein
MTLDSLLATATLSNLYFGPGGHETVISQYRMSVYSRGGMTPYLGGEWHRDSFPADAVAYLKKHPAGAKVFFEFVVGNPRTSPGVHRQLPPLVVMLTEN